MCIRDRYRKALREADASDIKYMVEEQQREIEELKETNESLQETNESLQETNENLQEANESLQEQITKLHILLEEMKEK